MARWCAGIVAIVLSFLLLTHHTTVAAGELGRAIVARTGAVKADSDGALPARRDTVRPQQPLPSRQDKIRQQEIKKRFPFNPNFYPPTPSQNTASRAMTVPIRGTSGIQGEVSLISEGRFTRVTVRLYGAGSSTPQSAYVFSGICSQNGATAKYFLADITSGSSSTLVDSSMADLVSGLYAINSATSANDSRTAVACGELKK